MALSFHQDYMALVEEIERDFPVARWVSGDIELWPAARMDLYLDFYRQHVAEPNRDQAPKPLRALGHLARPAGNLWKQRRGLDRLALRPRQADAIFLGDGVSLDWVDDAWEDRYGEPLMAALDRQNRRSFLMQAGDMRRSPWRRPTFAANLIDSSAQVLAPFRTLPCTLPGIEE